MEATAGMMAPDGLRAMLDCSAGWGEALTLWKYYVEHGIRY
jgi:hypothetical protein